MVLGLFRSILGRFWDDFWIDFATETAARKLVIAASLRRAKETPARKFVIAASLRRATETPARCIHTCGNTGRAKSLRSHCTCTWESLGVLCGSGMPWNTQTLFQFSCSARNTRTNPTRGGIDKRTLTELKSRGTIVECLQSYIISND